MKLPLKPGVTTTEFWTTIVAGLLLTALSAMTLLDAAWVAGAVIVLTLAYNGSRANLKKIQAEAESKAANPTDQTNLANPTDLKPGELPPDAAQ